MKKSRQFSRLGIAAKGIVYFLMGVMAATTAFRFSSELRGSTEVVRWISHLSFGWFLLLAVTIGLAGYTFSRIILTFNASDYDGSDSKPLVRRAGYFINGCGYLILLYSCISILIGATSDDSTPLLTAFLKSTTGQVTVCIVGIGLAISAINEWYMATGNLMQKMILKDDLSDNQYSTLLILGRVGRFARGFVFAAFSYLLFRSLWNHKPEVPKSTEKAFAFINFEFGDIIMGLIAIGLAFYGLFLILSAKHRNIPM